MHACAGCLPTAQPGSSVMSTLLSTVHSSSAMQRTALMSPLAHGRRDMCSPASGTHTQTHALVLARRALHCIGLYSSKCASQRSTTQTQERKGNANSQYTSRGAAEQRCFGSIHAADWNQSLKRAADNGQGTLPGWWGHSCRSTYCWHHALHA